MQSSVLSPQHFPDWTQIDDVLLSADHVLPNTSPHMAPESITLSTGLSHYLASLAKIAEVPDIRLALGGHEGPITDLYGRVAQIQASHKRKLERVLSACAEPRFPSGTTAVPPCRPIARTATEASVSASSEMSSE